MNPFWMYRQVKYLGGHIASLAASASWPRLLSNPFRLRWCNRLEPEILGIRNVAIGGSRKKMYRYLILALVLAGCAMPTSNFTRPAELYHPGEYPWFPIREKVTEVQTHVGGGTINNRSGINDRPVVYRERGSPDLSRHSPRYL